jgi:hypothetical protein
MALEQTSYAVLATTEMKRNWCLRRLQPFRAKIGVVALFSSGAPKMLQYSVGAGLISGLAIAVAIMAQQSNHSGI